RSCRPSITAASTKTAETSQITAWGTCVITNSSNKPESLPPPNALGGAGTFSGPTRPTVTWVASPGLSNRGGRPRQGRNRGPAHAGRPHAGTQNKERVKRRAPPAASPVVPRNRTKQLLEDRGVRFPGLCEHHEAIPVFTALKVLLMLLPSVVTIVMHATRISASMTA